MKDFINIKYQILLICSVLLLHSCQDDSLDENFLPDQINNETSQNTGDPKIWKDLDIVHSELQKELDAKFKENINKAIPNPFLPLIQANSLPSGNALNVVPRSGWLERNNWKRVDGVSTNSLHWPNSEHFEMNFFMGNYGEKGYIRTNFYANVYNQNHKNPRYYRFVVQRLDGSNWVSVVDQSGVVEPKFWTNGNNGDQLYTADGAYNHFEILDNNQRNKWYRVIIYGYVDYPNEGVWRHIEGSVFMEKFDRGF